MPVHAFELLQHIHNIVGMHTEQPKKPENATRIWDGKTPFVIHPIWSACMIATEQALSEDTRKRGMLTLLYHDIIEDTDGKLPDDLPSEVVLGIRQMTFRDAEHKLQILWDLPVEIRLYELYDAVSNHLDRYPKTTEEAKKKRQFVYDLTEDVEKHYGKLNITVIARALLSSHEDA
jgi:hypothetical protein